MVRILVTGGSGFLGGVIINTLLARGHSVVTTVRSSEKAQLIQSQQRGVPSSRLTFKIVGDIAAANAFDQAVICDPPISAVIHTASPFHYNITNVKEDMLDPAVNGTVGILQSVHQKAPSVERVVITSSFAAMFNPTKPTGSKYSEQDWNPVTWDDIESPENSLGASKEKCPPTGSQFWVDVRDAALAHALAVEKTETAGKRYFLTAGNFCNAEIVENIRQGFQELQSILPSGDALRDGEYPPGGPKYGYDNSSSINELGLAYRSLQESVVDTVRSMKAIQEQN
ncbi:uncharacterized protein ATNIH1004_005197 [Aspergillus tanneri]|uniref:NAD-dependent epimerase/dehydratase domain-containing protein n=1 Tax=Aspergillus tanneri TaxID=1220188 RepID=A0A5M9MTM5_9EURO|nr:uncharacterized protein ATNIH1004_005197 [Aspergillus tanneri]KAA8649296.1 hypothetical protein ATNIH1004_005197 [Aspergillus tanneri]